MVELQQWMSQLHRLVTVPEPKYSRTNNRPTNWLPKADISTQVSGPSGQRLVNDAASNSSNWQQGTTTKVIEPLLTAGNHLGSEEPKIQSTQQFSAAAAKENQEGDSKKRSYKGGKYRWSEESKTTKTNNQIRVSYHKEETMEQKNGEIYSATESYVKYYTETGYAKKKEKEKFWRKFWKILGWTLAILALVGTLYISTIGYQQANGPLNDQCNQPIGSQQSHKKNWGSDP